MTLGLRLHGQAFAEAFRRLLRQPVATATSALVLGLVIALPVVAAVALRSLAGAAAALDTDPQVHVFLALDAVEADVKRIEAALRAAPGVANLSFVPREQALAELKATTHLGEMLSSFDRNPLPHAFTVRLGSADAGRVRELKRAWATIPKVDEVVADVEWTERLGRWIRLGERLVLGFGVLLAAAVVFVVSHLIRLQVLARRPEIELSRLIGATRADVRRPFLYSGGLQGLLAGAVAVGVSAAAAVWLGREVGVLTPSYMNDFKVIFVDTDVALAIVVGTGIAGAFAALLAVHRELRVLSAADR